MNPSLDYTCSSKDDPLGEKDPGTGRYWSHSDQPCFASLSYNYRSSGFTGYYQHYYFVISDSDYENLQLPQDEVSAYWARQISCMGFKVKFMGAEQTAKKKLQRCHFRIKTSDYDDYIHTFVMLNILRIPFEYPLIYKMYLLVKKTLRNVDSLVAFQMALIVDSRYFTSYGSGHLPMKKTGYSSILSSKKFLENMRKKSFRYAYDIFNTGSGKEFFNEEEFKAVQKTTVAHVFENENKIRTNIFKKLLEYVE